MIKGVHDDQCSRGEMSASNIKTNLSPLEGKGILGEVAHTFKHATYIGRGDQLHLGDVHKKCSNALLNLGKCSEPCDVLQYKPLPSKGSLHERHVSL